LAGEPKPRTHDAAEVEGLEFVLRRERLICRYRFRTTRTWPREPRGTGRHITRLQRRCGGCSSPRLRQPVTPTDRRSRYGLVGDARRCISCSRSSRSLRAAYRSAKTMSRSAPRGTVNATARYGTFRISSRSSHILAPHDPGPGPGLTLLVTEALVGAMTSLAAAGLSLERPWGTCDGDEVSPLWRRMARCIEAVRHAP
jgi:hypothetical protein